MNSMLTFCFIRILRISFLHLTGNYLLRVPKNISINHFSKCSRFILPEGKSCAASCSGHGTWLNLESTAWSGRRRNELHPPNCSSCHSKEEAVGLHDQPFRDSYDNTQQLLLFLRLLGVYQFVIFRLTWFPGI